jgi:rare lipoprotein A
MYPVIAPPARPPIARLARAPVAAAMLAVAALAAACSGPDKRGGKRAGAATAPAGDVQHGLASWYGGRHHGGPTASGERFDKRAMTAAHRSFKMNTRVRVTNKRNGRSVIVRINDRGPFVRGRIIDVSEAAAVALGMKKAGVVPVKVERLR